MENGDLEIGNLDRIQEGVRSLLDRVNNHEEQFSPSIGIVPLALRDGSKSFLPQEISIGHHQHEYRIECEMQKSSNMIKLMNRIPYSKDVIFKSCMEKVYASMKKIRACCDRRLHYLIDELNTEFAEMMVMDACFILGFINKISENHVKSYRGNMLSDQRIIYDLVLLVNQIPFFFLEQIFECTVLKFKPNTTFVEFIRPLLNLLNIFEADIKLDNISTSNTDHILSLLYECYKPRDPLESSSVTTVTAIIPSAVDLDRAGVSFKPAQNPNWLMGMDVKFRFPCFSWCGGKPTLRMPVLYVHDFTELVLRNLIAYEHHSKQTHKYITSYAYAMDKLVNTQEDVAKLVESKVLVNYMGSNEQAANMINNLCKQVAWEDSFYEDQWKILNKYSNSYWPKNIARMKSTYFNSPWNIIALLAGIILFALTIVQTIFTIKSTGSNK